MAQQVDTNALKKAEASASIAKDMVTQAIEQSASNQTLCEEALKQASTEFAQARNHDQSSTIGQAPLFP